MFLPLFFAFVMVSAKTVNPGMENTVANLAPGHSITFQNLFLECLWAGDGILIICYVLTAATIARRSFKKNSKNVWRPLLAAVLYLPWLIPLTDIFRQWIFLNADTFSFGSRSDYFSLDWAFWILTSIFIVLVWIALRSASQTYGYFSFMQRRRNKKAMKARYTEGVIVEPKQITDKQLTIRYVVQIVAMVLAWFVAMWICDQLLVIVPVGSLEYPLFLGNFDISGFSNFAASIYQALGFPMAQGKPYLLQML